MKEVTAYEDSSGGLHPTEADCAAAELQILSLPNGEFSQAIDRGQAAKLVENRRAVISVLEAIDAPRIAPTS